MKTVKFMMALAAAATLASCGGQAPKANLQNDIDSLSYAIGLQNDIDSLSYAIGMARTEGLDQFLMQQGVDTTMMAEFLKGFNDGSSKISKKDIAYGVGMQVGQMVSKNWVEGFNQQIFGKDSTKTISRENLLAGFVAGVVGKGGYMNKLHAQSYVQEKMDAIRELDAGESRPPKVVRQAKFLQNAKVAVAVHVNQRRHERRLVRALPTHATIRIEKSLEEAVGEEHVLVNLVDPLRIAMKLNCKVLHEGDVVDRGGEV